MSEFGGKARGFPLSDFEVSLSESDNSKQKKTSNIHAVQFFYVLGEYFFFSMRMLRI